jgi:hypothetical protein
VLHQIRENLSEGTTLAVALFALALIPFVSSIKLRYVLPTGVAVVLLVLCCFMKLETRITLPLFTWFALLSIYYLDVDKATNAFDKLGRAGKPILKSMMIIALFFAEHLLWQEHNTAAADQQLLAADVAAMKAQHASLFVIQGAFFPLAAISPFENPSAYLGDLKLSTPYAAICPPAQQMLLKYGHASDIAHALMQKDVLFIGSSMLRDRIAVFYWEHYRLATTFKDCDKTHSDRLFRVTFTAHSAAESDRDVVQ